MHYNIFETFLSSVLQKHIFIDKIQHKKLLKDIDHREVKFQ